MSAEPLLTVTAVAVRLNATPYTVRAWAKSGALRGSKPGGKRWLFDPADVDAFLEAGQNRPRETESARRRRRRAAA